MTACSETEVLDQSASKQAAENAGGIKFDVYTQRGITRAGTPGDLNNDNIGAIGFGVFAYYTADGKMYSDAATPNFMYNQKVTTEVTPVNQYTKWGYEPVKYWPNEFGDAAISDNIEYVTFFAYAPWTEFVPTTGDVAVPEDATEEQKDTIQKRNIISTIKHNGQGDPMIKYIVDTDPATSVDLLWGVAAENANDVYSPIAGNATNVTPGKPFIDMVKPNNPQSDKLLFNLKHALAKVKVTIDYIADEYTPTAVAYDAIKTGIIDSAETRIYVRSFKITGFATKGALNLNNTVAGEPLWKDFDGVKDLTFTPVTFLDGRRDGFEGTKTGEAKSEDPQGLNPAILENYALTEKDADGKTIFGADKTPGVTAYTEDVVKEASNGEGTVLLFGNGDPTKNEGFFYVIPRNSSSEYVDVEIAYDVETIDTVLYEKLSDNTTHGSSIQNIIKKEDIFKGIDFKAGYQYEINIHLGMTSVKIDASVQPWVDNGQTDVELPDNQNPDQVADTPNTGSIEALIGTYAFTSSWDDGNGTSEGTVKISADSKFVGSYVTATIVSNSADAGITDSDKKFEGKTIAVPASAKSGDKIPVILYNKTDETFTKVEGITVTIGAKQ